MADAVAQRLVRCHCEAVTRQDHLQRREQVRRAVDERAVEIEDEEGSGHHRATIVSPVSLASSRRAALLVRGWRMLRRAAGHGKPAASGMTEDLKRRAAEAALAHVEDGMRLGLGTGSTAAHFVGCSAERVAEGLEVVGVPTSETTEEIAAAAGSAA